MFLDAEQAIIGSILTVADCYPSLASSVDSEDFQDPLCTAVWEAAAECHAIGLSIDIVSIVEVLKSKPYFQSKWATDLMYLAQSAIGCLLNTTTSAYILRDARLKRELATVGDQLSLAREDLVLGSSEQLLAEASVAVSSIAKKITTAVDSIPILQMANEFIAETEQRIATPVRYTGCHTGFNQLDEITSGWKPDELIIVAARPSMGKSAFMMATVHSVVILQQKPTLVFSLEMDHRQLVERLVSQMALVDSRKMQRGALTPEEMSRVRVAAQTIGSAPLYIHDDVRCTPAKMRAITSRLASRVGELGLICVDYLQIMSSGLKQNNYNRTEEVSHLSREMKALAREFSAPVMALSQLSRQVEQRQDKRPMLSDLRESGSIEQDADVVAFLYRDEYYNRNSDKIGIAEVIISKQRSGPLGVIELLWRPEYSQFVERPVVVPAWANPYGARD